MPDDSTAFDIQHDVRRRLCLAAAAVIAERGLANCSARLVAVRAGTSPSAINYHFERYDQLLALALDDARERDLQWRREALAGLQQNAIAPELLGSLLTGMITAAGLHHRPLALIRWDVAFEAALNGRFTEIAGRWNEDLADFWRGVLVGSRKPDACTLVAELCDALARIYLAAGTSATHIAWVTQACERVAQCLLGRFDAAAGSRCWRELHCAETSDETPEPRNATFDRIVDGALRVILSEGAHGLTHRSVASASGVSLSSTTYHFENRADIMKAAFLKLRAQTVGRALSGEPAGKPMTPEQLSARMLRALAPDDSGIARSYIAAQSLLNYAARDPQLSVCSQHIYASVGNPTAALFSQTAALSGKADSLSAFIFAVWTDVMLCSASLGPPQRARERVKIRQLEMLKLLFGIRF